MENGILSSFDSDMIKNVVLENIGMITTEQLKTEYERQKQIAFEMLKPKLTIMNSDGIKYVCQSENLGCTGISESFYESIDF